VSTALRFELGKDSVRLLSVLGMVKYLRRQGERAGTVIDRESCKGLTLAWRYAVKLRLLLVGSNRICDISSILESDRIQRLYSGLLHLLLLNKMCLTQAIVLFPTMKIILHHQIIFARLLISLSGGDASRYGYAMADPRKD